MILADYLKAICHNILTNYAAKTCTTLICITQTLTNESATKILPLSPMKITVNFNGKQT